MGLTIKEREKREKDQWLKAFGNHIMSTRLKKGISQADFARMLFMDQPNLTRIEKGRVNPSLYLIKQISVALDMTLQEFLKDFIE